MLVRLDTEFLHSLQEVDQFVLVIPNVIREVLILNFFPSLCRAKWLVTNIKRSLVL